MTIRRRGLPGNWLRITRLSLLRRHRPQIGDDIRQIGFFQPGIIVVGHRRPELPPVARNPPGDRTADLPIGPGANARGRIDERAFRWAMNEDPMATEKLAEGIRGFAKDLGKLRTLIAKRVEGAAQAAA